MKRAWSIAAVLMVAMLLGPEVAQAQSLAPGSYTFVPGSYRKANASTIKATIEEVASDFNALFRPIARSRLQDTLVQYPTVLLVYRNNEVGIRQGGESYTCPSDGKALDKRNSKGKDVRVSQKLKGSTITQTIVGSGGSRTTVYTIAADRKSMTMKVVIRSPKLDKPIRYTLTYQSK